MKSSTKNQSKNLPNNEKDGKYKKKKNKEINDDNNVNITVMNSGANNKNVKKSSKHQEPIRGQSSEVIQTRIINQNKRNNKNYWNNRQTSVDDVDVTTTTATTKSERSNILSFNRKLSNIHDSADAIRDAEKQSVQQKRKTPSKKTAFKFLRSVSLAAITLRKDYRYSMRKPKLEQLSEEDSHAHNSIQSCSKRNQHDEKCNENNEKSSSASVDSLCSRASEKSTFSLMSSLKRTFSLKPNRRKSSNPKWSASLLNLQQIDNMISYEDLSFIDYDKFNTYEQSLMRHLSQQDVLQSNRSSCSTNNDIICMHTTKNTNKSQATYFTGQQFNLNKNHINEKHFMPFPDVEMRLRRKASATRQRRHSTVCQCLNSYADDYNSSTKIGFNAIDRFKRWSNPCEVLSIEGVQSTSYASVVKIPRNQTDKHRSEAIANSHIRCEDSGSQIYDAAERSKSVDDILIGQHQIHNDQTLKSKSLTHLDSLETHNVSLHSKHTQANHTNSFHVYFDVNAVSEKEELLPAIKGATLGEVLNKSLVQRNLSASQLVIYELLTTGVPGGVISERTDAESLGGKYLIAFERDALLYPAAQQKTTPVQTNIPRPMRLYSSASAEETTSTDVQAFDLPKSTLTTVKPSKHRWPALFFGQKNPQQGQLCELLNSYAKNGVPKSKTIYIFEHSDYAPALRYLNKVHGSWKEFINVDNMNDREIQIQSAIWELVTTEVDHIHALQTVTELFLSCLEAMQAQKILMDVDQSRLFSNIREIFETNVKLWAHYLYPMVQNSIQSGDRMSIDYLRPGFEDFSTLFAPYKVYCIQQSTCQYYCKELNASNTLFTSYLAWCESQKLCNRLRLADILVRPTQRLTKYGLLLGAIRKHVTEEIYARALDSMIQSVEYFVSGVDTHLSVRQQSERLKGIMARIESYDVVDTNNEHLERLVKPYCTMFDLCGPMRGCATAQERHLFMEGDLRYKDSATKVDVHCFLLTDVLLVCKPIAKKVTGNLKVIRQPFQTDRLKISIKENTLYLIYLNEWDVATAAFTLQCTEARSWLDSFGKAKQTFSRLKQSSPLESYNINKYHSNEMLGIRKSPLNSSVGSRLSSLNNSHSGSVELNDSRNISMDYEKASSLSSDESMQMYAATPGTTIAQGSNVPSAKKLLQHSPSTKLRGPTPNTLLIQPFVHLGQSLPNLNLNVSQTSNNTLLVPGTSGHSNLLSPSQRGISYPPPSPRATLRRGLAFSSSIKNPPLLKSRNITSQSSISAYVPIPVIGSSQKSINTSSQSIESTTGIEKMKETSAQAKSSDLV